MFWGAAHHDSCYEGEHSGSLSNNLGVRREQSYQPTLHHTSCNQQEYLLLFGTGIERMHNSIIMVMTQPQQKGA